MKRLIPATVIALATVVSLAAQAPKGWMVRADRSTNASDPDAAGEIKFVTMGKGFHATNPQAAVYWNPAHTMKGPYSVKGTFVLQKPSGHTNYYGLVFGGSNLEGPEQKYLYFLVAQNGTWLIKRRNGDKVTEDVVARTKNEAVAVPDATGQSTNALEVRVTADKVEFLVNGKSVHSAPKTGMLAETDGIAGIRVNHQLEVHIDGFAVTKG
jgi:hypothetical protein